MRKLGVGIIGASAARGWASISHVPAVKALAGLDLVAVASGDQEKAEAAASAFGASAGYGSGFDLIRDAAVEIVAIAVKVPDHRELFMAAVAEGKHIYCEWPLGRNLPESREMADAASAAGVHVAIGLQTRANPAAKHARTLIHSGAIGRVLNARVRSTTGAFGRKVEGAMAFAELPENGVTLPTIQGAHTLDLVAGVLGAYSNLGALTSTQYPEVEIGDPAKAARRSTPDHMLVQAKLVGEAPLAVEVAGGRPDTDVTFLFDIVGEKGTLTLVGGALRGFQSGRLILKVNGAPQAIDEGELASLPDAAVNVAGVYAALRDDIVNGSHTVTDCAHAVRLTKMMDDVLASSIEGVRKQALGWPI